MNRKFLTIVASLLVLSFGLSANADERIEVSLVGGFQGVSPSGYDVQVSHVGVYDLVWSFETDSRIVGASIGFSIYSPDGSIASITWVTTPVEVGDRTTNPSGDWGSDATWNFPPNFVLNDYAAFANPGWTGVLPDGFLTGGAADGPGVGFGPTAARDGVFGTINLTGNDDGDVLCIDSMDFPAGANWLYATDQATEFRPEWGPAAGYLGDQVNRSSAFCMELFDVPDQAPVCVSNDPVNGSHCGPIAFSVTAADPEAAAPLIYSASHNGAGSISAFNTATGSGTYSPSPVDVGESVTITVNAAEPDGPNVDCEVAVTVTNNDPVITCPANHSVPKGKVGSGPAASTVDLDGACDNLFYSFVSVSPAPFAGNAAVSVDPNTGVITFDADVTDANPNSDKDYEVCIRVSDGMAIDECCVTVTVLNTEAFLVCIDQTPEPGVIQGGHQEICLTFEAGSNTIGGFDFLIAYDASALSFVGAVEGSIYPDYAWEYFTYRFGPNGNCSGGCPSGKLRVTGLAETNNGAIHPNNVQLVAGDTFACLDFLVSNDRNLGCQFVPIRWCWLDCGDNTLSSGEGDTLYISRSVFDIAGSGNAGPNFDRADITGADQSFPTLTGAPDVCDVSTEKGQPERFIDFCNGGIKIICPEDIDDRGDVNLNGLANEIADAVMFTEYFIQGLAAFGTHIEGSTAATEVNGDGIPLTVADLVYLIRVIVGDALPLPKLVHNASEVTVTSRGGIVSADTEMGAALFEFAGEVNVELLAANMNMKVGTSNGNTVVLVYNIGSQSIAAGDVLATNGELVSVEAADYFGNVLNTASKVLPTSFAVHQNYPNPFNPSTKISFDLPFAQDFSVAIYNVAGQKVHEINGFAEGFVTVEWDASSMASGIYFYKVTAGELSATKKMALLK